MVGISIIFCLTGLRTEIDLDRDGILEAVKMEVRQITEMNGWKEIEFSVVVEDNGEEIVVCPEGYGELMENLFPEMIAEKIKVMDVLRPAVIVKTPCSGTGIHTYGKLVMFLDGRYMCFDVDGVEGVYKGGYIMEVWRHDSMGPHGAGSPFLSHYYTLDKKGNWEFTDRTFELLVRDEGIRKEWLEGVGIAIESWKETEDSDLKKNALKVLEEFKKALESEKNPKILQEIYSRCAFD